MRLSQIFGVTVFATLSTVAYADESAAEFFAQDAARANPSSIQQAHRAPAQRTIRTAALASSPAAAASVTASSGGNATIASWYGGGEKLAKHTASGEVFMPNGLSAAHRTLPLGTRLNVSANGRSVLVRVNDRGPAKWTGRSLDLSRGAARALNMIGKGTARVTWRLA